MVTTVLQYLVIAAVIALVLFGLALLLFGRGEQMPPLPARTSPASLPSQEILGDDVRSVKFSLAVRGYRMSDVDWTLDRLADELDRTREKLQELETAQDGLNPLVSAGSVMADDGDALANSGPHRATENQMQSQVEPQLTAAAERNPIDSDDMFAEDPPAPGGTNRLNRWTDSPSWNPSALDKR